MLRFATAVVFVLCLMVVVHAARDSGCDVGSCVPGGQCSFVTSCCDRCRGK